MIQACMDWQRVGLSPPTERDGGHQRLVSRAGPVGPVHGGAWRTMLMRSLQRTWRLTPRFCVRMLRTNTLSRDASHAD
jgi:hypothetical protein